MSKIFLLHLSEFVLVDNWSPELAITACNVYSLFTFPGVNSGYTHGHGHGHGGHGYGGYGHSG